MGALLRMASAPVAEPALPGTAAINLTIRADIAGRPDSVAFRAVSEATGETRELGTLDFTAAGYLTVELAEGSWLITADAGDQGNGETVASIVAGENTTTGPQTDRSSLSTRVRAASPGRNAGS